MHTNSLVWHLFILCGAVFFHAISVGSIYRACLYLNLLFVIYLYIKDKKENNILRLINKKAFYLVGSVTILLLLIDLISSGEIHLSKEINRIILMQFICFGVLLQAVFNSAYVNKNIKNIVTVFIVLYLLIQLIFIFVMHRPFGTLKNPHYLAQYSILLIPICIFLFYDNRLKIKIFLLLAITCFVGLLLHTHSRPAWLSIILTLLLVSFHHKHRIVALGSLLITILTIWFTNLGNFAGHLTILFAHLKTEERAYIWRDIWNLQLQSSLKEWVFGRGIGAYESHYTNFGSLELGSVVTYNSPHNFLLEIIYCTGFFGLILVLAFYCTLYAKLFETFRSVVKYKNLSLLTISLLTINLLFVSIIVPFFSSYHLLITAVLCGVLMYIKEQSKANT